MHLTVSIVTASLTPSIVTTSSCEGELVTLNSGASYLVWAAQLFEGFGLMHRNQETTPYAHEELLDTPVLLQDNRSTIHLIEKGCGNFKNTKHT